MVAGLIGRADKEPFAGGPVNRPGAVFLQNTGMPGQDAAPAGGKGLPAWLL